VVPSPRLNRTTTSTRAQLLAPLLLLAAFMLAGVLALAATDGLVVHADTQPTLTVTIKSGTATQTTYSVVAANFPANAAITETFGDGSLIAPFTGQTNASGSLTAYWTLDVANTYCGTLTAKTDTAQATTSFWVAPSTDAQSGTACGGTTGAASPTPNTTATAAAQTTASATAAPTQPPIAQPTVPPAGGTGSGDLLHQVLGSRVLLLVGGGAVALVMLILLLVLASTMLKSGQRKGSGRGRDGGGQPGARYGGWNASPSAKHAAQGWRPQQTQQTQQTQRTPTRMAGAGNPDSRWRSLDDEDREDRQGTPDPRWSRSQPGAQGGRGPRGAGDGKGTAARMRTLRDFTEPRQSVRPPSREDDNWTR
jgi:hypothetical protein